MRPPEQVKVEIVRQWTRKAETDLKAAEALCAQYPPLLYPACFHAQQCAEKYLKAFLTWQQVEFPKTHALGELLDLVNQVNEDLADKLSGLTVLNPYGVEVRYPSDIPEPNRQQAEEALELGRFVRKTILSALPSIIKYNE
ncbi:MAG: HEPN domain-containing protein [Actinobacteria bacterium]|nr:HEPN domain-containing protein [Actinomycetota bacterium]